MNFEMTGIERFTALRVLNRLTTKGRTEVRTMAELLKALESDDWCYDVMLSEGGLKISDYKTCYNLDVSAADLATLKERLVAAFDTGLPAAEAKVLYPMLVRAEAL